MTAAFVPLALLMFAVTYPSRALPMLAPGIERLPRPVLAYLRLVGPACLAALAAVNSLVTSEPRLALHLGVEPLAVVVCALVAWRWSLLPGIVLAVVLVYAARTAGLG